MTQLDLWSTEHFNKKMQQRIAAMTPADFTEPWEEAKERYIHDKVEPLHDQYRQSDHSWFKDFCRRKGEVMHASDLIFRLQRLNPHIFVQQQINFENDWGLYIENLGRIQYLSAVPKGFLTEWSYAIVDDRDLPLEERRGWRTVIVMCLCKGALTWQQVLDEFEEPSDGLNEQRWQEATADIRHGEDGIWLVNSRNTHE